MRKEYIQLKIYKVKSNIYKRKQRYGPKIRNKDKKRQIRSNKNLEKYRKKEENGFENTI